MMIIENPETGLGRRQIQVDVHHVNFLLSADGLEHVQVIQHRDGFARSRFPIQGKMDRVASPEHGGEVGTQILDFRIPDIQGEDLIQNPELLAPVKLLIVEKSSIQDYGILKQRLDLLFDF
jgi:hypothetical protein